MALQAACVVDNRDAQEMYGYLEARVETLKRRIKELEKENEVSHTDFGRRLVIAAAKVRVNTYGVFCG